MSTRRSAKSVDLRGSTTFPAFGLKVLVMATKERKPEVDEELLAAFSSGRPPTNPHRCALGRLLDELEEPQRAALQAALDNPDVGASTIERVVRDRKIGTVSHPVIRLHRKGGCLCVR